MLKTVWKMLKIMLTIRTQQEGIIALELLKKTRINKANKVLTKGQKGQNSHRIQWLKG